HIREDRHLAYHGQRRVDQGHGRPLPCVVPEVAQADENQERRVDEGETTSPVEKSSACGHYREPCPRAAPRGVPREPMPAWTSAMRAMSCAPTWTLRPKLNVHASRSSLQRARNSGLAFTRSRT